MAIYKLNLPFRAFMIPSRARTPLNQINIQNIRPQFYLTPSRVWPGLATLKSAYSHRECINKLLRLGIQIISFRRCWLRRPCYIFNTNIYNPRREEKIFHPCFTRTHLSSMRKSNVKHLARIKYLSKNSILLQWV